MRHPNWKVAGAAGLAAGLTVGGFSLVAASSVERAVRTVEVRESHASPAADSLRLAMASATTAPTHSLDPASPDKPTVTTPSVVSHEPAASPSDPPTPKATVTAPAPKATVRHQRRPCTAMTAPIAPIAPTACTARTAQRVDSVNSVASVSVDSVSVDSVDSDD